MYVDKVITNYNNNFTGLLFSPPCIRSPTEATCKRHETTQVRVIVRSIRTITRFYLLLLRRNSFLANLHCTRATGKQCDCKGPAPFGWLSVRSSKCGRRCFLVTATKCFVHCHLIFPALQYRCIKNHARKAQALLLRFVAAEQIHNRRVAALVMLITSPTALSVVQQIDSSSDLDWFWPCQWPVIILAYDIVDFTDKFAEFVWLLNYANAVRNKNSECGWICVGLFCVSHEQIFEVGVYKCARCQSYDLIRRLLTG